MCSQNVRIARNAPTIRSLYNARGKPNSWSGCRRRMFREYRHTRRNLSVDVLRCIAVLYLFGTEETPIMPKLIFKLHILCSVCYMFTDGSIFFKLYRSPTFKCLFALNFWVSLESRLCIFLSPLRPRPLAPWKRTDYTWYQRTCNGL